MTDAALIRDSMTLTTERLATSWTAPQSVLVVAARTVSVAGDISTGGRSLTILCEEFDGTGGTIDLSAPPSSEQPGGNFRIVCSRIIGLRARTIGGRGAQGMEG